MKTFTVIPVEEERVQFKIIGLNLENKNDYILVDVQLVDHGLTGHTSSI